MSPIADEPELHIAQRAALRPDNPRDHPTRWRRFLDFLRTRIGMKPLWLAERWAEARVAAMETDNSAKLLAAKKDYELAMSEIRRAESRGRIDDADAELLRAKAKSTLADAKVKEAVARLIEARNEPPEQSLINLEDVIQRLLTHGAVVEVQPPELPESEQDSSTSEVDRDE